MMRPRPRVAALFSGAGGMSLGFHAAGCEIISAVEIDPHARATHELNFAHRSIFYRAHTDIARLRPADLVDPTLGPPDIIIAGPPCQPFSRVGRARIRAARSRADAAWLDDPRVGFLARTVRLIARLRPVAFVIENVPDLMRFGGRNLAEEICERLAAGYRSRYFVLQAAWYGVPQYRERLFIAGIRREAGAGPSPPQATHRGRVPSGYLTSSPERVRSFALGPARHLVTEIPAVPVPLPFVTVIEAIGDLPGAPVAERTGSGHIRFAPVAYPQVARLSVYARLMRTWPGFEAPAELRDHVTRLTPRDFPIFARMRPGDEYPEAVRVAERIFQQAVRKAGNPPPGSHLWKEIRRATVPPYPVETYPNRWWKLVPDAPSRTLTAHLGRDCYSHIHHAEPRTISVREAARLQSFPDGYRFSGPFNARMRMIGNAVPPLLALAVARQVLADSGLTEVPGAGAAAAV